MTMLQTVTDSDGWLDVGSLTTPFTPAPTCTKIFSTSSSRFAILGPASFEDDDCWPTSYSIMFRAYFKPGLVCPSGWASELISSTRTTSNYGLPSMSAGETAAVCCPRGLKYVETALPYAPAIGGWCLGTLTAATTIEPTACFNCDTTPTLLPTRNAAGTPITVVQTTLLMRFEDPAAAAAASPTSPSGGSNNPALPLASLTASGGPAATSPPPSSNSIITTTNTTSNEDEGGPPPEVKRKIFAAVVTSAVVLAIALLVLFCIKCRRRRRKRRAAAAGQKAPIQPSSNDITKEISAPSPTDTTLAEVEVLGDLPKAHELDSPPGTVVTPAEVLGDTVATPTKPRLFGSPSSGGTIHRVTKPPPAAAELITPIFYAELSAEPVAPRRRSLQREKEDNV
ncbi:hypothetical protein B0H63DRAFT_455045 [Podospora didyma]|uniref:Uncharacterized protein n=1 Tax=Podospora didyma TaxID=330526 RepID=A0AAE0K1D2_9PEZI|nr:hypothetical protein B0H63DRAFT_455045 [Podospora didyma]